MLLELHAKYTMKVLKKIDHINEEAAPEILKGSFVNDLCEVTNVYTKFNNTLKEYLKKSKERGFTDYFPVYQSHHGKLSVLHCMANTSNEAPEITHENIFNWLNFFEFIIFNVDKRILDKKINKFQNILGDSVDELQFKISRLLDTHNIFEAKYRAIGMIIHMIEDSYTVSHCKRGESGIITFHFYPEQSSKVHKKNDFVLVEHEEKMLSEIKGVLTQLLSGNSANSNYQEIFNIDSSATPSSDGGLV